MPSMWEAGMGRDREGPKNFGYIFVSAIKPFPLCSDAWLLHGRSGCVFKADFVSSTTTANSFSLLPPES